MGLLEQLLEMIPDVLPVEGEVVVEEPEVQDVPEVKVVREVTPIEKPAVNEEIVTEETKEEKFKINAREMIIYSEIMKPKYLE